MEKLDKDLNLCDMDDHRIFLDRLYVCRDKTAEAIAALAKVPYQSRHIRKAIKALWKELKMLKNDIRVEQNWRQGE